MSMVADGVGSLDGARGISSAIWKSSQNENDDNDDGSRSFSSKLSVKSTNDTDGNNLSKSICDHGENLLQLTKIKADQIEKNRAHEEAKEKQKRSDAVDQQILSL